VVRVYVLHALRQHQTSEGQRDCCPVDVNFQPPVNPGFETVHISFPGADGPRMQTIGHGGMQHGSLAPVAAPQCPSCNFGAPDSAHVAGVGVHDVSAGAAADIWVPAIAENDMPHDNGVHTVSPCAPVRYAVATLGIKGRALLPTTPSTCWAWARVCSYIPCNST
jgi:hypothetical protein